MSARKIPDAIQWHDGMLLTPDHFNQLTQRQEMLSEFGMASMPFRWGLVSDPDHGRELPYDPNLLVIGQVSLTDLEAVMPDGTVIHSSDSSDLKLDLKPLAETVKTESVPIYLVLPVRKRADLKGDLARYQSLRDSESGDEDGKQVEIPRLVPRLRLMAGPDPIPPKYTGFPLLKVRFENGAFLASREFAPPTLGVTRKSALGTLCLEIAQRIREKASYLAELVRSTPPETSAHRMVQIQCLVTGLPAFEALLYTDRAHPYSLYLALCGLAGSIAGVGNDFVPPPFPAYDHNDPRAAFERVQVYLYRVMEEGISERWLSFRFHREDRRFTLSAKLGWTDALAAAGASTRVSAVLGIRGPSGCSDDKLLDWGRNCLISSRGVIPSLIARRILGMTREPLEWMEDPVPAQGLTLFALRPDPELLVPEEDLQALDPRTDSVVPAEMLLYIRRDR